MTIRPLMMSVCCLLLPTLAFGWTKVGTTYQTNGSFADAASANAGRSRDASKWVDGGSIPTQPLTPAYFWNNVYPVSVKSGDGAHIQHGRDFYEDKKGGVAVGTWANRPGPCTNGQAMWVTDRGEDWCADHKASCPDGDDQDGALFVCDTTKAEYWQLHYVPYPYPHPLVSGASVPDPKGPQVAACAISNDGHTVTITTDKAVSGSPWFSFYKDGTRRDWAYVGQTADNAFAFALVDPALQGQSGFTLNYDATNGSLVDATGTAMASVADFAATNDSTVAGVIGADAALTARDASVDDALPAPAAPDAGATADSTAANANNEAISANGGCAVDPTGALLWPFALLALALLPLRRGLRLNGSHRNPQSK